MHETVFMEKQNLIIGRFYNDRGHVCLFSNIFPSLSLVRNDIVRNNCSLKTVWGGSCLHPQRPGSCMSPASRLCRVSSDQGQAWPTPPGWSSQPHLQRPLSPERVIYSGSVRLPFHPWVWEDGEANRWELDSISRTPALTLLWEMTTCQQIQCRFFSDAKCWTLKQNVTATADID